MTKVKHPVALDLETYLIGAESLVPKPVCASFSTRDEQAEIESTLIGNHEDDGLEAYLEWCLTDDELLLVTHNGGYDYAVAASHYPHLIPLIFRALLSGKATDTLWREKLLNLSTTGRLEQLSMPDGTSLKIRYGLDALVLNYFGVDISEDKNDTESWRFNYNTLDGWRAEDYPEDAREYAISDTEWTLRVYEAQEARKMEWETASTTTEGFQLAKAFVLYLMTAWGMQVDQEATTEMEAAAMSIIESNKNLLEDAGILRTAGRIGPPYKKDLEKAYDILVSELGVDGVPEEIEDRDWNQYKSLFEGSGIKFKIPAGKPGSIDTKVLQKHLEALYKRLGKMPEMTDGGTSGKVQIKCDAEVQEFLAEHDPVMAQYHQRASLGKIVSQMIPALRSGPVVHPSYDAIKETGRTSSYDGGQKNKVRQYASVNIQQIPGMIQELDPRKCFQPREGTVFFDVDFTGLELACVGHVTHELFGESVHRSLYNSGVDLHGYLGAQLALNSNPKSHPLLGDFQSAVRDEGISGNAMAVFEAFKLLKSHEEKDVRDFFKHFRNFAKPVGLGFPGGLGAATMVEFARKTYGVSMTEDLAREYKDFWLATYPEMVLFFDWINSQVDTTNSMNGDTMYEYTTPMGMVRRGASFCAAANGACMQSPGAEAAMSGAILVSQACYDHTQESVLYGCRPIAFVHDQLIGETTDDPELWAPQCEEVARLMRTGAEMVLDSIKMRTDEALLTTVWSKSAEPVRNEQGILVPWTP